MKVLVISAAFPPMRAGEADHAYHFCRELTRRGIEVDVLTTRTSTAKSDVRFTVHPIMRDWSWSEFPRLARFIRRSSPGIIVLRYIGWVYGDQPMITFAPTLSKRVLPAIPFIADFANPFGMDPGRPSIMARSLRKCAALWAGSEGVNYRFGTLLRDSDRVVAYSEVHRDTLAGLHPGVHQKSTVIPPPPAIHIVPEHGGATRRRGRDALGVEPHEFLIAYFGYIYPNKGVETLLKALQLVSHQRNGVRLVVIGGIIELEFPDRPRYAQEMHALPAQLEIEDKVTWTGAYPWDSDQASVFLRAADVCVLPFDAGVQLNNSSFAAAAAHGLPIVTTRGVRLEPPFVDRYNVLLCPPKSPGAVAGAIGELIDDPALRERLSRGSLELAKDWFSWEHAIDRTFASFPL